MSKLKVKPGKISSPFDMSSHKTERTAVAILMYWMREIIKNENLDLGMPDVETAGKDRKMPDAVIYESPGSNKILCLIEAKPPYFDVFDERYLKEPARIKAMNRKAKYFVLTNFKKLIWFNTEKVNSFVLIMFPDSIKEAVKFLKRNYGADCLCAVAFFEFDKSRDLKDLKKNINLESYIKYSEIENLLGEIK